jgi:hypothetical protein
MQATFKVPLSDAQNFQKIWTNKGIAIVLPPEAAQFAMDFANVVLRNFIEMVKTQQAQEAKPVEEKKLIIEGV